MDSGIPLDAVAFCATLPAMAVTTPGKSCAGCSITCCGTPPALKATAGRGLWATRKLLLALAGSGVLTWWEWVEHHPPQIVIVALVHFVFLFAVIALLVYVGLWFRARRSTTSRTPP